MSCDIRKYESLDLGSGNSEMSLTAFMGGEKGSSIQFTINGNYCALGKRALLDLVMTITKRLKGSEGYTATGAEREDIEFKQKFIES